MANEMAEAAFVSLFSLLLESGLKQLREVAEAENPRKIDFH